ncbi:hypothetical protein ACOSQ3_004663 [Xanthoceras sorbifolium]
MFLIGLQMDISYTKRNLRIASTIAYSGVIASAIFGASVSGFIIQKVKVTSDKYAFAIVLMLLLANSAAPVVIRLATELKFDTSNIGRLAISSSLINEISCALGLFLFIAFANWTKFKLAILSVFLTGLVIIVNKYLTIWFNTNSRNQKYITNSQVLLILLLIMALSMLIEYFGLYCTIPCFLVGLMFPRQGKTTRTLVHKLSFSVHEFILPIYFGYTRFQFDLNVMMTFDRFIAVVVLIMLSFVGKIVGTLVACYYLKIPLEKGVILCFILNLKGHVELLIIDAVPGFKIWWNRDVHNLLLAVIVLNTVIAGPVVSFILRKNEKYFAHEQTTIEFLDPESELQMASCVYAPRNASGQLGLMSAMHGSQEAPTTPYLMHLVELPKKSKTKNLMYQQLEDGDQFSDEEDFGGNAVLEINDSVDSFTAETKYFVHQIKVVSSFPNMYDDVCTRAEDLRLSIIFLPFHKHQRIDGKMEKGKDEVRTNNRNILRHAPCSIGILVDRGCLGFHNLHTADSKQHVAALFFGGPDDREALACSKRIAMHRHLHLTVIRFLPESSMSSHRNDDALQQNDEILMMSMSRSHDTEAAKDKAFIDDFYNRYVTPGQVGYVEKYVKNAEETISALIDIGDMYSLFVVGKGGRGHSTLATDINEEEECPELGSVGNLLASMDFDINSSILVVQQHTHSNKVLLHD